VSIQEEELIKVAPIFGGEEAIKVIKSLLKMGQATDDEISTESEVKLNDVRKILYKLYDHALVFSNMVRDSKSGWYIFYWKLHPDQLEAFIKSRKMRVLDKLKQRLAYEKNHTFFICKNCPSLRYTFEEAVETAFICNKCGSAFDSFDNSDMIPFLEKKVEKLEKELKGKEHTSPG
jgi:transcription initiation factor TFIIE subunit alpha